MRSGRGRLGEQSTQVGSCARVRREPERTLLYALVRENLETLLEEHRELPRFVRLEFEKYLDCGILGNGFARVHCAQCGADQFVAFSCKRRGFCPSCNARRMHDTAAHLVDRVFPRVPIRQWVLSLPRWARWLLARDEKLTTRALRITLRHVFSRYRGKRREAQCGAVTFIQRFGSALNLNVHFHCVLPDGSFVREDGKVRFIEADPPSEEELRAVLRKLARRLQRMLRPKMPVHESDLEEVDREYAASIQSLPAARFDSNFIPMKQAAYFEGFSLHAAVHIHANNREGLEHLCAYGARGPLSLHRLTLLPNGRLLYRMKRPMSGGKTELVLTPLELLRKLATLIPPPMKHAIRFHGVFAPNSPWRPQVVPAPPAPEAPAVAPKKPLPLPSRIPWAELFRRVFKEDVLQCARCGGRMEVISFLTEPAPIKAILASVGLPSTGPPRSPPRRPDSYFDAA
jgi:hypothetical protein